MNPRERRRKNTAPHFDGEKSRWRFKCNAKRGLLPYLSDFENLKLFQHFYFIYCLFLEDEKAV